MGQKRVLIWVQHLLGMGHLNRASLLARALADDGFDVTLVSGGQPAPSLDHGKAKLVQLPWCRAADDSFQILLDEQGQEISPEWKSARQQQLMEIAEKAAPDALITELFPLGRRQMRFELLPLLQWIKTAQPQTKIVASLRDILVRKNDPKKLATMQDWARDYYDAFLIHGDPSIATLDPVMYNTEMQTRAKWTGFMVDTRHNGPLNRPETAEILVSAGSGSQGWNLLETAMRARLQGCLAQRPWRFLVGPAAGPNELAQLRTMAAPHATITVEPARKDFPALLGHCFLSISQGGYNTSIETLVGGCRAVFVPFAGGKETEQTERSRVLAKKGNIAMLDEGGLTPERLAVTVENLAQQPPTQSPIMIDGMKKSVEILRSLL